MRNLLLTLLSALLCLPLSAEGVAEWDRTLRVDYQFSGNAREQHISLGELCSFAGWAGRTVNMDRVPMRGNGDITLSDARSGEVLYKQSFTTLFQEWVTTDEARQLSRSFENTFLLPMPHDSARVTVNLYGMDQQLQTSFTHTVRPDDILIRRLDRAGVTLHRYLLKSGSPQEKIDVAIVAEGFTAAEMDAFYRKAQEAVDAILAHEPFKQLRDRFNFVAVGAVSMESDVSIPQEGIWRQTALSSHFSTFYSDRYLTTLRMRDLHNLLSGIPYEHIIILANTHTYGGGGIYNAYTLTTTHNPKFRPVVVHEFGHSFAGLGDEYAYNSSYGDFYFSHVEPWEQNLTTLCHFEEKWQDMLPEGTAVPTPADPALAKSVGVYEGAGYMPKGVYRPYQDCRMRTNECEGFCPVCQRAIRRLIDFYTGYSNV